MSEMSSNLRISPHPFTSATKSSDQDMIVFVFALVVWGAIMVIGVVIPLTSLVGIMLRKRRQPITADNVVPIRKAA